ncbi:MAG: hypothetical protein H6618_01980 [Deltaproteobacteria bacterium]|nr:hypothetical protein [Deltaproteobacteria bacterium]
MHNHLCLLCVYGILPLFISCSPSFVRPGEARIPEPVSGQVPLPSFVQESKRQGSQSGGILLRGKGSWLIPASHNDVWGGMLEILLKNYNLSTISEESGVITTEWDKYYSGSRLYRNKISLRISPLHYKTVSLTLRNTTEELQGGIDNGVLGQTWIPADDRGEESGRLLKSLALWLGLPSPATGEPGGPQALHRAD